MNLINWAAVDGGVTIAGREKWDYTLMPELRGKVKPLPPGWQPPEERSSRLMPEERYTHVKDWPT